MKTHEFLHPAKDGTVLFFKEWIPEGNIKAAICLVHGLGDHSGLFKDLINYLNARGLAVLAFDLRGHGKSQGKRGHIPSYEALMEDIDLLLDFGRKNFEGLPLLLYGHSFGGNQVLNYILRRHPDVAGVMASAPWLSLYQNPPKLKLYSIFLLDKIFPTFLVDNIVSEAALSHKPGYAEAYSKDPLVHSFISARLFASAHKAGLWAIDHASDFDVPLLLFQGDEDNITSPEASKAFAANAPDNLCTFKLWKGLYHSLHNEISNQDIFSNIVNWINTKTVVSKQENLDECKIFY